MSSQNFPNLAVKARALYARGFTLIELLIVVAIIGILSSIAVPQYFQYVQKSRRADAQVGLMLEMQSMERCKAANYSYTGCNIVNESSPESHYNFSVAIRQQGRGFTLTATGVGKQANDTECQTLTITDQGIRTPSNETTTCWPN